MTDLDRLEALAREARDEEDDWHSVDDLDGVFVFVAEARFIAACDPATILALIVRARRGEEYKRAFEFVEALADGGDIRVNGIPWREAYERLNNLVPDPLPLPDAPASDWEAAVKGEQGASIDDLVAQWHERDDDGMLLHEFLGISLEECNAWATDARNVPSKFRAAVKGGE